MAAEQIPAADSPLSIHLTELIGDIAPKPLSVVRPVFALLFTLVFAFYSLN